MAVVIQYEFNTEGQWKNAGLPKLVDTATEIVVLGRKVTGYNGVKENGLPKPVFGNKYYVEVLFANEDEVPDNGLLENKAVDNKPHYFIGYPISINEQEKLEAQTPT